jgi:hypothetical protein
LLYQPEYRKTLVNLIDTVIETEAPIYADILVERIARAHGKERSGRIIQEVVMGSVSPHHHKLPEDDRRVIFHRSMEPNRLVAYRPGGRDWRSHRDIPLIELASIALPLVQKGASHEKILDHFAKTFDLSRLREPTRKRFLAAIEIANAAGSE